MAKFVDKCRTGIPADRSTAPPFSSARQGVPTASDHSSPKTGALRGVVNREAWGESQATQRYGGKTETFKAPKDQHEPESPENKQDNPTYHNDVPSGSWLRGGGKQGEGKPEYQKTKGFRSPEGSRTENYHSSAHRDASTEDQGAAPLRGGSKADRRRGHPHNASGPGPQKPY